MSHTFASQEAQAQRTIAAKGFEVTFTRQGAVDDGDSTAYPPALGDDTTFVAKAVQTTVSDRDKDGVNVRDGDVRLLVSTEGGNVPSMGDTVRVNARDMSIVAVDTLAPGGTALLFKVRARGG